MAEALGCGPPTMIVTPTSLAFTMKEGWPYTSSRTVKVKRKVGGGVELHWEAKTETPWLKLIVSRNAGSGSGRFRAETFTEVTKGMEAGEYSGSLAVTSNAINSPQTIPATLSIIKR